MIPPQPDPFADEKPPVVHHCPKCTSILYCVHCALEQMPTSESILETGVPQIKPDFTPIPEFVLSETDMRALLRQTYHQHITWEGSSGPALHALLDRIYAHLGREKAQEFLRDA